MKKTFLFIITVFIFIVSVVFSGDIANGVIKGLNICGQSLIPAIFPFSVISLFMLYTLFPIIKNNKTKFAMLFFASMFGGYPLGSKIVGELYNNKEIDLDNAKKLKCLLINAGPGFIISFIGRELFGSTKVGIIIFASQVVTAYILTVLSKADLNDCKSNNLLIKNENAFLDAVSNSAESVLAVCSAVILFSGYNEIFVKAFVFLPKEFIGLFEITTAMPYCKNVLLSSAMLSWCGLSVHLQVLNLSKNIKINYLKFIGIRLIHTLLSTVITYVLFKIFKVSIITSSIKFGIACNNTVSCIFLIITLLLLLIIISQKNVEIEKNM